jgi:hypothetical protein
VLFEKLWNAVGPTFRTGEPFRLPFRDSWSFVPLEHSGLRFVNRFNLANENERLLCAAFSLRELDGRLESREGGKIVFVVSGKGPSATLRLQPHPILENLVVEVARAGFGGSRVSSYK